MDEVFNLQVSYQKSLYCIYSVVVLVFFWIFVTESLSIQWATCSISLFAKQIGKTT